MARVFVSYARTDRRAVEQVAQELNAAGHEAWIDVEEIQAGESWRRSIVQSIAQSDAVVVFLSPSSATSRQLATEVNLAAESGKRIFAVKIADAELSEELRYDLAGLQFINLISNQKDGISALLAGLGSLEIDQGGAPPTALETRRAPLIGKMVVGRRRCGVARDRVPDRSGAEHRPRFHRGSHDRGSHDERLIAG